MTAGSALPFRALALRWLAAIAAGGVFGLAGAQTAPPVRPTPERSIGEWLVRMHDASRMRSYVGTFVVSSGAATFSSARIWHACEGQQQVERVESLTGAPRSTLRRNEEVLTFIPEHRVVRSEKRESPGDFPDLLKSSAGAIGDYYSARPLGADRVAGYDADVVQLAAKDGLRFGYRIWSEKRTGLVLKLQTLDEQARVLEQVAFSELQLDAQVSMDKLSRMMSNTEGYKVVSPELVKTTPAGKSSKGSIDRMRAQGMDVRQFVAELAELERRLAPLVEEAETIDAMLAPYEAIKEELKAARATLRRLKAAFVERLTAARAELDDDDCRELVLDIDRERLLDRLERARVRRVGALVADLERLWDKYRVSLKELEGQKAATAKRLDVTLQGLGSINELLTRGLRDDGTPRDYCELVETAVGARPASWKVANLSRFVVGAEYGTNLSLNDVAEGLPVLRMNNIQDGEFDLSDLRYAPSTAVERFRLKRNDVLFNRTNSWEHVGKAAIWRRDEAGPAFASYLVRLHCGDELLPEFLHLWLNWAPVQRDIRRFATPGVQQVNINPTNLQRALIAVPGTLDEQRAIVDRVNAVASAINAHRRFLEKLASLRAGLQDDLLTRGNLVEAVREAAE